MKISKGVWMLNSTARSHAYLVKGKENILIDTGFPGESGNILKELEKLGAKKLSHILLTHHDIDHIGNAADIMAATGAKLWAPEADIPYITGEKKREGVKRVFQTFMHAKKFAVTGPLAETFGEIQVIKAPGHTPGHVMFTAHHILFCGDLIKVNDGQYRLMPKFMNWNHQEALKSVKLLDKLEFDWICPAHGKPVRKSDFEYTLEEG